MDTTTRLGLLDSLQLLHADRRGHVIGAEVVTNDSGGNREIINPATGTVICSVPEGSRQDVGRAVAAAKAAAPSWAALTPLERFAALSKVADAIDANAESLARLESLNTGKPLGVSRGEIPMAADTIRFMAGAARTAHTPAAGEYVDGHLSLVIREPLGVVAAIAPWNYPFLMAVWKLAPALAAGNTVVLKPSELTPLTALKLAEIVEDTLPPGVLNIVLGAGSTVGEALADDPDVALIALTGSVASGQAVTRASSDSLKRVHLELGGNAPAVVFEDADIDEVANTLRTMSFWNSGQECGAACRVLVHEDVQEALIERLVQLAGSLTVGDPDEGEQIEIGPLISEAHRDRVAAFVHRAVDSGATVVLGGAAPAAHGWYYPATVITGVAQDSEIVQQEVFGPVVTVQTFRTEGDAVRLANDVPHGLSASVWTRDLARAIRVSRALQFGTVWVNSHLALAVEMPWGGFGISGHGRDVSTYSLDEYSRTKHVMMATS
jgi:1-pyrroline dehydrogenase